MISHFFIDRPIFATVLSIVIILAGLAAMVALPVAQFPEIVPPQIQIIASYPGANSDTVAKTVAAPIEQQINGVDYMIYMDSKSSSNGDLNLNVFFDIGTNLDLVLTDVTNRKNLADPQLPEDVKRNGVTIKKSSPNMLLIVTIESDGTYDYNYINNYASLNVLEELKRIPGANQVSMFGSTDYAMRIWLNPDRMANLGITVNDIRNAIREQNAQFPAGKVGQPPTTEPVQLTLPVITQGRFADTAQFDNIILRSNNDGSTLRLRDVATTELGIRNYDVDGKLNGKSTALLIVYQQPGANALDVAAKIHAKMEELAKNFPKGISYKIPYDTTEFVKVSIESVIHTFFEALVLVIIVVFLFLQNWRATLIPCLAVPVSIVGTFAGMYLLGFSINTLTLFGMVLAIGIVVDDAIVVVENVERNMTEFQLSPREAARRAMEEVTGPVIAIVLVLCAVFIPVAFLGGITGQLYKQFAITIAISVVISGLVALTLTPALAALLLRPAGPNMFFRVFMLLLSFIALFLAINKLYGIVITIIFIVISGLVALTLAALIKVFFRRFNWVFDQLTMFFLAFTLLIIFMALFLAITLYGIIITIISIGISGLVALALAALMKVFFRGFNWVFNQLTTGYVTGSRFLLRHVLISLALFSGLLFLTWSLFKTVPTSFVPDEDQGYVIGMAILPDGASLDRTLAVSDQVTAIAREHPAVANVLTLGGYSTLDGQNKPNASTFFIILKNWKERETPDLHAFAVRQELQRRVAQIGDANVLMFIPPAISGLGATGGFEFWIQNRGEDDPGRLAKALQAFLEKARQRPELRGLTTTFNANAQQLYIDLDRDKARSLAVPIDDVFNLLQGLFGSIYVNDFNKFGRTYRVMLQADSQFRSTPQDINRVFVRSTRNEMIPLSALVTLRYVAGPDTVSRFNTFPAVRINGSPAPGYSSGQALAAMEAVAKDALPTEMTVAWSGQAYQEKKAGASSALAFGFGLIMVFLILAAQYEKWSLPLGVLTAVPFGVFGALLAVWLRGLDNDVYFQIGLVTLIALAAKNAILIVEFAVLKREEGLPVMEAAIEAARLRFRPIVMTSLAFILGCVPLAISTGAGAASRHSIGTGVIGGMLGATVLAIFFVPLFYRLFSGAGKAQPGEAQPVTPPAQGEAVAATAVRGEAHHA